MSASSLAKFEQLKQLLEQGEVVPNLSMELSALSIAFASINDDYRLLDDEEQEQKRGDFLQIQYAYHEIAMSFIAHILEPLELGEANMDVDNYKNATEQIAATTESQANVPTENQVDLPIETLADVPANNQEDWPTKEQSIASTEEQNKMQIDEPPVERSTEPAITSQSQSSNEFKEPEQKARRPNPFSSKPSTSSADDGMPKLVPTSQPTKDWGHNSWASDDGWSNQSDCGERDNELPPPPYHVYCIIMEPLFALEHLKKVDERAINLILTTLTKAAADARKLRYSIWHDTAIIIAAISRKLDVTSQSLWSWKLDKSEPTLDGFVDFLTKRAKTIAPVELGATATLSSVCASSSKPCTGAIPKPSAVVNKNLEFTTEKKRPKTSCPRCSADHYLHRCEVFRSLALTAKEQTVDQARLCRNCFSAFHQTLECAKGACRKCRAKHNSLLCPQGDNNYY